jgi:hypothetical protein
MTSDFDYNKYSLEKLQEWVRDAMSSDASPQEIYSAIREAIREDYYYHKDRLSRAGELLTLLNSEHRVENKEFDYTATGEKFPRVCDKDDKSPECQEAWNSFWEENYYPEEHKADKVKRWVLPVEEDDNTGEYFVSFPDDLLEAANLKEGDFVDWVNQGDGSYLLKKHVERYRF